MKSVEAARIVIGIIGNIISFCLFASPIPTFIRIVKKKSAEEFKSDPYLAATMNCIFWILYSLPFIHPDSTLVLTINSIGLAMELIYLIIFLIYCDNQQRRWIVGWLVAEVLFTACIAPAAIKGFHTHKARSNFVGGFCVAFGILLYASPLTIMRKVIESKSVEYMPLWLSVAAFSNGVIWTIYSCLKFDAFMFAGNLVGTVLGATQLVLYWYYYNKTPKNPSAKQDPENQGQPQKKDEARVVCPWSFLNF